MATLSPELIQQAQERAKQWLEPAFDSETRQQVEALLAAEDKTPLVEAFYQVLEFGTGGLRGIMGAGTNRMNKYTVGMATQGLANYLLQCFAGEEISVAIGYDGRNNSPFFAQTTADVLTANGIKVYLYDALRPTPMVSYAIRQLGCKSGVMVTASHNPKEYNGYKVFWSDGAQEISQMMVDYRSNPMKELAGSPVVKILDYQSLEGKCLKSGETFPIKMPATSNVLQYHTADGTVLSIRPSGTEPKIKYYIGVTYKRGSDPACDHPEQLLRDRIKAIREQLSI